MIGQTFLGGPLLTCMVYGLADLIFPFCPFYLPNSILCFCLYAAPAFILNASIHSDPEAQGVPLHFLFVYYPLVGCGQLSF